MYWRIVRRRKEAHQVFMSAVQDVADELVLVNRDDLLGSKGIQISERACSLLPEISA